MTQTAVGTVVAFCTNQVRAAAYRLRHMLARALTMYTLAVTSFHVYTCMSIVATYQDADEKAERGMETSQVIDSDAARDADAEGGRGKRNKT